MKLANHIRGPHHLSSVYGLSALLVLAALLLISSSVGAALTPKQQLNARNAERRHDVNTIQSKIRSFSNKPRNHRFPSLAEINNTNWVISNLPSLPLADLADPTHPNNQQLSSYPLSGQYSYMITDSNGSSCETTPSNCSQYSISATYEGFVKGAATYVVSGQLKQN